jgi:hypothetical protein
MPIPWQCLAGTNRRGWPPLDEAVAGRKNGRCVESLAKEVAQLRAEIADLRAELARFRNSW